MDRETLLHLPVVARVAKRLSFAAAAAELGMSPSAVSHAVRVVEQRLGTPLFRRTTRSVSLTEVGESFLRRAAAALQELATAVDETRALQGRVSGVLRISAPRLALPMVLTALLTELAQRHPDLTVEVSTEEALIDIVARGYDAGVRLGEMIGEEMIAVRLTDAFRAILVASPGYLQRAGVPDTLRALQTHNTIGYRLLSSGAVYAWDVLDAGREIQLEVRGTTRVTDSMAALELALAGVGIAYLFEPLVRGHLQAGTLRQVLHESAIEEPGLFIYFPRYAAEAPKLRALLTVARERLSSVART